MTGEKTEERLTLASCIYSGTKDAMCGREQNTRTKADTRRDRGSDTSRPGTKVTGPRPVILTCGGLPNEIIVCRRPSPTCSDTGVRKVSTPRDEGCDFRAVPRSPGTVGGCVVTKSHHHWKSQGGLQGLSVENVLEWGGLRPVR